MSDLKAQSAVNRVAKWRSVFAGWQLGTRPNTDPECQAVRDHREATILLRAELNAMTALLINSGIFTPEEFVSALGKESDMLNADLSRRFPGITATDQGINIDLAIVQEHETMKGWKP